ncbi:MAG: hypothetical protein LBC80_06165, partial [Treponema sp.]|nr:hypothetical protein [Treponema sp.]
PHWRFEWVNPGGLKQIADFPPDDSLARLEIEIPASWTNPVTAWPYWPAHNLLPNTFRPAGALFPYDVSKDRLRLSWEAGPDTIFYWELAFAYDNNDSRIPTNFDWQRFRELFQTETLSEAVCENPWVVNWRSVAERTIESGFDRRRIVPEVVVSTLIPAPVSLPDHLQNRWQGPWYGASPFVEPLFFAEWEPPVFPVRPGINVWVSALGILRVNGNSHVFTEMRN